MQFAFVLAACLAYAHAQPVGCHEDSQCDTGYYCKVDLHFCRECNRCDLLKRQPPQVPTSCVKSVSDCGLCFPGLVDNYRGDLTAGCVAPEAPDAQSLPAWVWAAIVISLLLLALGVLLVLIYVLRHTDTFKILTSTRTSVQSVVQNGSASVPTAPQRAPPPPYNTLYTPLSPSSPPPLVAETEVPLVKLAESPPAGARGSVGHQAANVFNNPAYVRVPPSLPPSVDVEPLSDESDHETVPVRPEEEDTLESPWTPAGNGNDAPATDNTASASGATASPWQLALRRPPSLPELEPPSKTLCVRQPQQDSNNNREMGSSRASGEEGRNSSSLHSPNIVNVTIINQNTVQQVNNKPLDGQGPPFHSN